MADRDPTNPFAPAEQSTVAEPPSPGSAKAIALGCSCPVLDNAHGRGYMGQPGIYVYSAGCAVHAAEEANHDVS